MSNQLIIIIWIEIIWILLLLGFRKKFKSPLKPFEKPKLIDWYIVFIMYFVAKLIWIFYNVLIIKYPWIKI